MGFSVRVATDIYGRKHNREFLFPGPPTIHDLINAVESQYDVIGRATRPAGYPDVVYKAQTFQIFDSMATRWCDLFSTQQITNGGQLFCFQPESVWNSDAQEGIPEHQRIVTWKTPEGSSRRTRTTNDSGVPPSQSEKVRSVFAELDLGNQGFVTFANLRQGLSMCDIHLVSTSAIELFREGDQDGDDLLSYDEWVAFAVTPCNADLVSALFFRFKDIWNERKTGRIPTSVVNLEEMAAANARRDAAVQLQQLENSTDWMARRSRAQQMYEDARAEAAVARQQAELATCRERELYEELFY